ncbi:PseG/SpsG family protein [Marinitoga aeolica]|uniref:UDP-2,4-diacetamido-2,4, 6-trideoxy-beta-L-altropyranose hydrolase n=1 Tax=Marinitoga aeolica TaxID=2809031 RepID=A0ABY8PMP1_9BACT|nr:hypothetical protein [Marinitoga aeolica]WGS63898.1 hypothetical protein JRV97_05825 [Marinitoga aeolica]
MKIVFRTNGGKSIGLGHVFRCISLAKAIRVINPNARIVFISNDETKELITKNDFEYVNSENFSDINSIHKENPDLIVFDSYLANNNYLVKLKKISKLAIFDDNNDIYDSSIPDIIINGNIHAFNLKYDENPKKLLGPKYLVMKEEYWNNDSKSSKKCVNNNILITTGGSDPNKLMIKFVEALSDIDINKKIIIGPMYEEKYIEIIKNKINDSFDLIYKPLFLKDYIDNSDIVITSAGSTIYEVLTLKKTPIIYTIAKNQELIAKELEKFGVINFGNYKNIDFEKLGDFINEIASSIKLYSNKIQNLSDLYDGKGALRVAKTILEEFL